MTSEEIRKLQREVAERTDDVAHRKDMPVDALYAASLATLSIAVWECSYQLAVMNEREAAKVARATAPLPFVNEKELPRPGAALAYCKCASIEGDNPACPIHCATMSVTP